MLTIRTQLAPLSAYRPACLVRYYLKSSLGSGCQLKFEIKLSFDSPTLDSIGQILKLIRTKFLNMITFDGEVGALFVTGLAIG
jgi:hypothetical protein